MARGKHGQVKRASIHPGLIALMMIVLGFPGAAFADDPTPSSSAAANDGEDRFSIEGSSEVAPTELEEVENTTIPPTQTTDKGKVVSGCQLYYAGCRVIDESSCAPETWTGNMRVYYDDQGKVTAMYPICTGDKQPAVAQVTGALVLSAFRTIAVPKPTIGIQPPPGTETLVNIETVFTAGAQPFKKTVTLLGQQVTLDIKPGTYTWTYGDGAVETTKNPGRPVTEAEVELTPLPADLTTHTYTTKGDVTVTLATTWTATWSLNGGPYQPVPGTVTTTSAPHPLAIREARPILVE